MRKANADLKEHKAHKVLKGLRVDKDQEVLKELRALKGLRVDKVHKDQEDRKVI